MKITQAQIEAALIAYNNNSSDNYRTTHRDGIIRALTAAAEAEKYPTGLEAITAFEKAQKFQEKEEEAKRINEAAGRQERALATAAEVGWPSDEFIENIVASATEEDSLTKVGPHPAAAEAGEPSQTNMEIARQFCRASVQRSFDLTDERTEEYAKVIAELLDHASAATVERCAQKIKQFAKSSAVVYRGTEPIGIAESKTGEPVVWLICEYLEAAIRAMKENH